MPLSHRPTQSPALSAIIPSAPTAPMHHSPMHPSPVHPSLCASRSLPSYPPCRYRPHWPTARKSCRRPNIAPTHGPALSASIPSAPTAQMHPFPMPLSPMHPAPFHLATLPAIPPHWPLARKSHRCPNIASTQGPALLASIRSAPTAPMHHSPVHPSPLQPSLMHPAPSHLTPLATIPPHWPPASRSCHRPNIAPTHGPALSASIPSAPTAPMHPSQATRRLPPRRPCSHPLAPLP